MAMLKSMLVGLDGSPYSASAIDLGICWAKRHDALLVGVGIIDEPGITRPEAVPLGAAAFKRERDLALLADTRRKVERFLERFTLQCAEAGVAFKILEDVGQPAHEIALESQRYDLILLGRKTFFQFETVEGQDQTLFQVLKQSPRPVVTVPSAPLAHEGGVLVAYDGSLQAARALQVFVNLGLATGQSIDVLSIGPSSTQPARLAERALDFLRLHDVNARAVPLALDEAPGEVLLDYARRHNPAMVVMGVYGQPTWKEFFFGSVTRTMLKLSPAPLFLCH
jgi:nucleotide-binding universal stress UspA family protein